MKRTAHNGGYIASSSPTKPTTPFHSLCLIQASQSLPNPAELWLIKNLKWEHVGIVKIFILLTLTIDPMTTKKDWK